MANQTMWLYGALGVMAVLLLFSILEIFSLHRKVNSLIKKYRYFMTGEDGVDLERKLGAEVYELREMAHVAEDTLHQHELLSGMQMQSLQRVGLVKYDAFGDTGDSLSFSLTILDATDNGFILSSIVGRDTSRMYVKQVIDGKCHDTISSEEEASLAQALAVTTPYVQEAKQESENQQG